MHHAVRLTRRFFVLLGIFGPAIVTAPAGIVSAAARDAWYRRIVDGLERAGATFIKLGQIASSRPDLVPPELCEHLSRLHDQAPAHDYETTRALIETAFERPIDALFATLETRPIASGSIAQVHRGRLVDGTDVAVKVRHPDAEPRIETDLEIIRFFARIANLVPTARWLSLPEAAAEFSRTVHSQIDLTVEAHNLERFDRNFADHPQIHFPRPIRPYVDDAVLVETFEEGKKLTAYIGRGHPLGGEIARGGLAALLKMIFDDGFVHADLHPGNLLVRIEGDTPHVVMLDVGMVAELSEEHRRNFTAFFGALALRNGRDAGQQMITHAPDHECKDPEAFKAEIERIFREVETLPIEEIEVALVLSKILASVRKHRIKIESAFTSVNVGMMVLEGIGRQLDPTLNLLEEASPILLASIFRQQAADRASEA